MVDEIKKQSNYFKLITKETNFKVLRVVLAIGKSGNARILNVPGENLPKIFNRLFDPADAKGQNVLVGGGGDSALETAIATSEYADTVVLSYRKPSFARPKEANLNKLNQLVSENKLNLLMESNVKEIKEEMVVLLDNEKNETEIKNSMVFTLIGRELPVSFFKRSGIKMEGELSLTSKLQFLLLLFVAGVIYFGNSSADFYKHFFGKLDSFGDVVGQLFTGDFWIKYLSLSVSILTTIKLLFLFL